MKKLFTLLGIIVVILVVGFVAFITVAYNDDPEKEVDPSISSLQECVDAGYPLIETYPQKCQTPDGKIFVEKVSRDEIDNVMRPITIRGVFLCLPHWDMTSPHTLECTLGLKDDDGNHYTLSDPSVTRSVVGTTPTGVRVEIKGEFTPGSHEVYRSIGMIKVESITIVENI